MIQMRGLGCEAIKPRYYGINGIRLAAHVMLTLQPSSARQQSRHHHNHPITNPPASARDTQHVKPPKPTQTKADPPPNNITTPQQTTPASARDIQHVKPLKPTHVKAIHPQITSPPHNKPRASPKRPDVRDIPRSRWRVYRTPLHCVLL